MIFNWRVLVCHTFSPWVLHSNGEKYVRTCFRCGFQDSKPLCHKGHDFVEIKYDNRPPTFMCRKCNHEWSFHWEHNPGKCVKCEKLK